MDEASLVCEVDRELGRPAGGDGPWLVSESPLPVESLVPVDFSAIAEVKQIVHL